MKKIIVRDNEKGLLFKNGKYVKTLNAGKYYTYGNKEIIISYLDQPIAFDKFRLETLLADENVAKQLSVVEVKDEQLALHYVNGTFVKEAFEKAKGSVLFIDEAYSLVEDRKGSYGTEAINTIVQEMENCREDTIVILAGYPEEMQQLLEWNPGMKSRIAFHVPFDDYTEQELLGITKLLAKDRGMRLDAGAEEKLLSIYAAARKDKAFGNGRFARNLLEKAKFNQANRFMKRDLAFVSDEEICTLVADDFDYEVKKEEPRRLGFGA